MRKIITKNRHGTKWLSNEILSICRALQKQLLEQDLKLENLLDASGKNLAKINKKINFTLIGNLVQTDELGIKNMLINLRKRKYDHILPKNWKDEFR